MPTKETVDFVMNNLGVLGLIATGIIATWYGGGFLWRDVGIIKKEETYVIIEQQRPRGNPRKKTAMRFL